MPDLPTLQVPDFARLSDYAGVWAIDPTHGAGLLEIARRADLTAHVRAAEQRKAEGKGATLKAASDYETVKAGPGQQIAIVRLAGPLMKQVSSMSGGTSTVAARRAVRKAAADPEVSAILVAIDSPGGTVSGTADLAADVKAAAKQKPVWAHVDDLGASAAYWIASQADRVFANTETALVGSIGTLAVVYDLSGQADKEGVKTLVFGTGPLKGAGTPGAPVTEDQQEYFRGLVENSQQSFDAAVQKARGLTDKQLAAVKTGGVFGAAEALERKLIDGVQSIDATLSQLAAEARRRGRTNQTTRAAGPIPERSATVNEFEKYAAAQGFPDVSALTEQQTTFLRSMFEQANKPAPTATATLPADPLTAQNEAAAANVERIAGIQRVCKDHGDIAAQAIRENWSVDRAENAALKAALPRGITAFNPAVISRSHDKDCSLEALQAAIILRAGVALDNPAFRTQAAVHMPDWLRAGVNDAQRNRYMDFGHRYSQMSAIDLCRESLRLDGKDAPYGRSELIKAAVSGGSLTNIFTTSVNAVLLATFAEAGDTTQGWTRTVDVADFKPNERIRLEKMGGSLPKLPRGGTADHAKRSDTAESYRISRFAEQFAVDEQDFIDDSLNAISDTPREMALKALRLRPDLVYAILLANPTLTATGRALFNTTDGNTATGAALAADKLKALFSAMMLTRENAVNLNITPTHLIVPPTLAWTAKELRNSTQIVIAGTAGSVTERGNANVLADVDFQIVTDSRLENGVVDPNTGTTYGGSSSTYYAASTMVPTIEVAYLRGTGRVPQVRSYVLDKGSYGLGWDIKYDIGAKAMAWHGLHRRQQ